MGAWNLSRGAKMLALALAAALLIGAAAGAGVRAQPAGNGVYDTDGDGLIEIGNLEQLDAIRHDLDGDGVPEEGYQAPYVRAFPGASGSLCGGGPCHGYELARSLDFLDPDSYASGAVNPQWTTGHGWIPLGWCSIHIEASYAKCGQEEHAVPGDFAATFQGNGNTIANLYSNFPNQYVPREKRSIRYEWRYLAGLFGEVNYKGVIDNVGLEDVYVIGDANVGSLVGKNWGLVKGSYATGVVIGSGITLGGVGGLVGENHTAGRTDGTFQGTIEDSYTDVAVESEGFYRQGLGFTFSGGLVGVNESFVLRSHSLGQVKSRGGEAGGLVGYNTQGGSIRFSYATGPVYSSITSAGGLAGLRNYLKTLSCRCRRYQIRAQASWIRPM